MAPFYKATFGNKKIAKKLHNNLPMYCYDSFCSDLLEMFELFPKSYKRPYEYTKTEQGIVLPVLKKVDQRSAQLHASFYQGINESLKRPIPDLVSSLMIIYILWLDNLQKGKMEQEKHCLTIESCTSYIDEKDTIEDRYKDYNTNCLRHVPYSVKKAAY